MPFVTIREYKPTIRKRASDGTKELKQNLAGMPVGLLLAITYSASQELTLTTPVGITDISVAGRITQNTINIRVRTD